MIIGFFFAMLIFDMKTIVIPSSRLANSCESIWNGDVKKLKFATKGKPKGAFVKVVNIAAKII